jgi:hypothetical protein
MSSFGLPSATSTWVKPNEKKTSSPKNFTKQGWAKKVKNEFYGEDNFGVSFLA